MAKTVIVTGATSGIGLATARMFLKNGYTVYGVARKPYSGEDFTCYCSDVCDYENMQKIFEEIYAREGSIDILINNAGFGIAGAVEELSPENIQKQLDVNLTAVCVLCGKIIPFMKPAGGKIINISSVGGIMPLPYQSLYSASKAGVEVFSRALANEVKPYKIKVCAVLPGDTKTGFTSARICEGANAAAKKSVEKMSRDEQRGKSPDAVAKVILKVARKKRPPLRVSVGGVSKIEVFLSRIVSVKALNKILGKMYG